MTRTFEDRPAARERVPLLVGIYGPSGGGKTYSALRIATGIQRVTGGDIFVVDTESRRALHYADDFSFRHVAFDAPFSPLDYLAVIEHCVKAGAATIVIDSLSHEHDGEGGVLAWQEAEVERLSHGDTRRAERIKFLAWQKPKRARRQLINAVLQLGVNAVFCFRAKEKLKIVPGKDPVPLGWMPIAGDEFLFEMTVNALLPPGAEGVPQWVGSRKGETMMIKLPRQFRAHFLEQHRGEQLSEQTGRELAEWAAGTANAPDDQECENLIDEINSASTLDAIAAIARASRGKAWTANQRARVREAIMTTTAAIESAVNRDRKGNRA